MSTDWTTELCMLLKAVPEHIKPAQVGTDITEKQNDLLSVAKEDLQSIPNGVETHYIDLGKTNKRRRDEVVSNEEEREDGRDMGHLPVQKQPPDH